MAAPLPTYQREYVVQLLALGNTKREIQEKFEARYHRTIHPVTISRIKSQNKPAISDAHDVIATGSEIVGAATLKQKAYRALNRKMDRAEQDETEIDKLRAQLRAGEIDKKEFDMEVARYEVLTVRELTQIADSMHQHSKNSDETPQLTPADQAALQALMAGINNGNPLQLIQVLNPTMNVHPTVGSQAPPADTPVNRPGDPVTDVVDA